MWKNVKSELPPYYKQVIVAYFPRAPVMEGRIVGVDRRIEVKGTSISGTMKEDIERNQGFTKDVTHWMEIEPIPPLE